MSSWQRVLTCLTVLAAVALLGPASALAGGPSAGDQQYIDPLGGSNSSSGSHHSTQPGSTTTPTPAPAATTSPSGSSTPSTSSITSTGSTATASSATSAATTSSSTLSADPHGKQLPFTGFDAGAAALIGVLMLGGGLFVRRAVVRDH